MLIAFELISRKVTLYKSKIVLYYCNMTSLSISELRADISKAVKSAKKNPIEISKHGEPVAVLVSPSLYEKMIGALEELEDIAAFDEAIKRKDESVLWEKARKDLGLA